LFAKIREDFRNWREATAPVSTPLKVTSFPICTSTDSGDTDGKAATDVNDASGILPPVSIIAGGKFSTGAISMVINYNNIRLPTPSLRKKFPFTTEVIDTTDAH
jgi:hypothetical protein